MGTISIAGIDLEDVPEGWSPFGVAAVFKCLDEEGKPRICLRVNDNGWSMWELIGALETFAISLQNDLQDALEDDDSEPEEPE